MGPPRHDGRIIIRRSVHHRWLAAPAPLTPHFHLAEAIVVRAVGGVHALRDLELLQLLPVLHFRHRLLVLRREQVIRLRGRRRRRLVGFLVLR